MARRTRGTTNSDAPELDPGCIYKHTREYVNEYTYEEAYEFVRNEVFLAVSEHMMFISR